MMELWNGELKFERGGGGDLYIGLKVKCKLSTYTPLACPLPPVIPTYLEDTTSRLSFKINGGSVSTWKNCFPSVPTITHMEDR